MYAIEGGDCSEDRFTSPLAGEVGSRLRLPGGGVRLDQPFALAGAPKDASGIAAWIGFHNASSCSGVRRVRDAITRPPNAAVFTAAHPPLPTTRIGTVTTAASAAASSAGLAL